MAIIVDDIVLPGSGRILLRMGEDGMRTVTGSIEIIHIYARQSSLGCGLMIKGSPGTFPLLVGCSLKTRGGRVIDVPARWILSPGNAFWVVDVPDECRTNPGVPIYDAEWRGFIIFALYYKSHSNRLSDTSWQQWHSISLIGSSTKALDLQDREISEFYRPSDEVWREDL